MTNRTQLILDKLTSKASLKQSIYTTTLDIFNELKIIAQEIASELDNVMSAVDEKVVIEYSNKGDFEFHLKFSGDTLVFQMHSNIVTLPLDSKILSSAYFEIPENRYFGSIRIYNFLSDTIKYNRLNDQGILMARMLINREKHYYIESEIYFTHLQPSIEKNIVNQVHLRFFIESAMISAIDNDLIAPPYEHIHLVSLSQQLLNNQGEAGSKLGFQLNLEKE